MLEYVIAVEVPVPSVAFLAIKINKEQQKYQKLFIETSL